MKATGIIRRVDDLGRVVIPREIRRNMRIREGDPLEVFTNRDGSITFKKYVPLGDLTEYVNVLADVIYRSTGLSCCVVSSDEVLAIRGMSREIPLGMTISEEIFKMMNERSFVRCNEIPVVENRDELRAQAIFPIEQDGDIIGAVCILINRVQLMDNQIGIVQALVDYTSKQMSL
jgi:AbrB family transcriptional regulator (stage V sporulation protein T)